MLIRVIYRVREVFIRCTQEIVLQTIDRVSQLIIDECKG